MNSPFQAAASAKPRSRRVRATAIHLLGSLTVATLAAIVIFVFWYPPPYAAIAGGIGLFVLLGAVDVVLGPVLTAVAANPAKRRGAFRRDVAIIVFVQAVAFAYGMHTVAVARPVHLVFEVDRLRVVTAVDFDAEDLAEAPPHLRSLPWSGPTLIAAIRPTAPDEVLRTIDSAMAGVDISMMPRYWRDYGVQADAAWRLARPVPDLLQKHPQAAAGARDIAAKAGQPVEALRFLPLLSRHASWVALVTAPQARIVGYLPVDGFL